MTESLYKILIEINRSTKEKGYTFRLNDHNKKLDIYFLDKKNPPERIDINRITSERLEEITKEEFANIKIRCDCRQYAGDADFKIELIPVSAEDESQKYRDHYMRLSEKLSQLSITLHTGNKPGKTLTEKQRTHYHNFITALITEYILVGRTRAEEKKAVSHPASHSSK